MLRIAKILKSNGTDGGLLVSAPEVELEEIQGPVFIDFDGLPAPFFITACDRRGSNRYVIRMSDVRNLKDAEELVGRFILFDGEFEDEDASADFTGWTVYDSEKLVGKVTGMEPIPGNLCLYVASPSGEVMIPLHEDFIVKADSKARILYLNLPAGLW